MLHNPACAGVYAYGRSTLDPRRRQPGRPCTGRVRLGRDQWLVFLPGVLPAYISIGQAAALAERQRPGEEYDRFTAARPRTLTTAERGQIRVLAADLPAVWNAATTSDADRKQLIRHLVEQVRVTVLGASEKVDVEVTWAGGHRTAAQTGDQR